MSSELSGVTRRQSATGTDLDGRRVTLSSSVAKKLYRCPGCGGRVAIGSEHILVRFGEEEGPWHQHWHRACASEFARRELRGLRPIRGGRERPSAGGRRRAALERRRRGQERR